MVLTEQFRRLLVKALIDETIISFLDGEHVGLTDEKSFSNLLEERGHVNTIIFKHAAFPEPMRTNLGQAGKLMGLCREIDAAEELRIKNKAKGVGPDNLEGHQPDGEFGGGAAKFAVVGVHVAG